MQLYNFAITCPAYFILFSLLLVLLQSYNKQFQHASFFLCHERRQNLLPVQNSNCFIARTSPAILESSYLTFLFLLLLFHATCYRVCIANQKSNYLQCCSRTLDSDFNKNYNCHTPRKKFYLNFKNRFFNFISSIGNKNTFRTNMYLFYFKKLLFQPFLNERNYSFNIIYLILIQNWK